MESGHSKNPFPYFSVFCTTLRKGTLLRLQGYVKLLVGQNYKAYCLYCGDLLFWHLQPISPTLVHLHPMFFTSKCVAVSCNVRSHNCFTRNMTTLRASPASPRGPCRMAAIFLLNTTANAAPTGAPTDDPRGQEIDADPCH